jgi:hypothetical protein
MSGVSGVMPNALATLELNTVMVDPVSSQNSYSSPFIRTRMVGVPIGVIPSGSVITASG